MVTFKTATYYTLDYNEFEKIIQSVYGISEFSIVADMELMNDISVTYVVKKEPHDGYDTKKLEKFIATNGNVMYMTRTLLTDLCNKDVIPEGDYLIKISW